MVKTAYVRSSIRGLFLWILIWQKHMDPPADPDQQHWLKKYFYNFFFLSKFRTKKIIFIDQESIFCRICIHWQLILNILKLIYFKCVSYIVNCFSRISFLNSFNQHFGVSESFVKSI